MRNCLEWVGLWKYLWGMVFVAVTDMEKFSLKLCGTVPPFGSQDCARESSSKMLNMHAFLLSLLLAVDVR